MPCIVIVQPPKFGVIGSKNHDVYFVDISHMDTVSLLVSTDATGYPKPARVKGTWFYHFEGYT